MNMLYETGAYQDEKEFFLGPVIGRGTTGFVYEGFRRSDGFDVVIKVLSKKLSRYPTVVDRLRSDIEAAAQADVQDPHVAKTLGMIEIEGRLSVIIEKAPGEPLSKILQDNGPLTDRRALKLALQIAKGLLAAAKNGLHHGDVRPHKLYCTSHGKLMITDFGMAFTSCVAARFKKFARLPYGHPEYLAPEVVQYNIEEPSEAADLYALGISLYEMVCGVVPFRGMSAVDTLRCHLEDRIPPPPPGVLVNQDTANLILSLTAKDPARRCPDLRECVRQLKGLLRGKDPMEVSVSGEDWAAMSQEFAALVDGWDADALQPEEEQGEASMPADDASDVVLAPDKDYTGRTGFFKAEDMDEIREAIAAAPDPFEKSKVRFNLREALERLGWTPTGVALAASLVINLLLIVLLLIFILNRPAAQSSGALTPPPNRANAASENPKPPPAEAPPKDSGETPKDPPAELPKEAPGGPPKASGPGEAAPKEPGDLLPGEALPGEEPKPDQPRAPGAEESADPELLARVIAAEQADAALAEKVQSILSGAASLSACKPSVVLVYRGAIWINLAALPTAPAGADDEKTYEVETERQGLIDTARELLDPLKPSKGVFHPDVFGQVDKLYTKEEALSAARRAVLCVKPEDAQARLRAARALGELVAAAPESAEDCYTLAVGHAALQQDSEALAWLRKALSKGFKNASALGIEPLLARLRDNDPFWALIEEFSIPGLRRRKR